MATAKPRTNTKRAVSSRPFRVAKKKQGVSKKQALILVAVLALIGVVAVVASKASTSDYVYIGAPKQLTTTYSVPAVQKISTDGASKSIFEFSTGQALYDSSTLSRDKNKILVVDSRQANLYNSRTGALIKQMPQNIVTLLGQSATNGRVSSFLPGDKSVLINSIEGSGGNVKYSLKIVDLYSGSVKTIPTPSGYMWMDQVNLSRDGKKIVYVAMSQAESRYVIITSNIDGGNAKIVRKSEGNLGRPQWSNDGKKFSYYESDERSTAKTVNVKLRVMNGNGTDDKALASVIANHQRPGSGDRNYYDVRQYTESSNAFVATYHDQWSSGSNEILYKRVTPGHVQNLFTVNVNTGKSTPVTNNTSPETAIGYYGVTAGNRIVYSYGPAVQPANSLYNNHRNVVSVKFDGTGRKMLYSGNERVPGMLWW